MMKTTSIVAMLIVASCAGVYAQESERITRFEALASAGDHAAAHQLAMAYTFGDGVPKNLEAATFWYWVASKPGSKGSVQTMFGSKDASLQTVPEVSTWKKMTNVVAATPAKAQAFLSDHSDDISDLATFLLERYVPGLAPTEETVTESGVEKSSHQSK